MCVREVLIKQQDFEELEQKGRLILVTGKTEEEDLKEIFVWR